MNLSNVVCALLGASASLLVALPEIKRMHNNIIKTCKLKMISEALKQAEEREMRYAERHDLILEQICSSYLINQSLQEALDMARDDMSAANELVVALRKLQLHTIDSFC